MLIVKLPTLFHHWILIIQSTSIKISKASNLNTSWWIWSTSNFYLNCEVSNCALTCVAVWWLMVYVLKLILPFYLLSAILIFPPFPHCRGVGLQVHQESIFGLTICHESHVTHCHNVTHKSSSLHSALVNIINRTKLRNPRATPVSPPM